jgi:hypothetical protein
MRFYLEIYLQHYLATHFTPKYLSQTIPNIIFLSPIYFPLPSSLSLSLSPNPFLFPPTLSLTSLSPSRLLAFTLRLSHLLPRVSLFPWFPRTRLGNPTSSPVSPSNHYSPSDSPRFLSGEVDLRRSFPLYLSSRTPPSPPSRSPHYDRCPSPNPPRFRSNRRLGPLSPLFAHSSHALRNYFLPL